MSETSIPRWRTLVLSPEARERHLASGLIELAPPPSPKGPRTRASTARVLAAMAEYLALPQVRRGDLSFIARKHEISSEALNTRLRLADLRVRMNAPRGRKTCVMLVCEVNRGQNSSKISEPTERRTA